MEGITQKNHIQWLSLHVGMGSIGMEANGNTSNSSFMMARWYQSWDTAALLIWFRAPPSKCQNYNKCKLKQNHFLFAHKHPRSLFELEGSVLIDVKVPLHTANFYTTPRQSTN